MFAGESSSAKRFSSIEVKLLRSTVVNAKRLLKLVMSNSVTASSEDLVSILELISVRILSKFVAGAYMMLYLSRDCKSFTPVVFIWKHKPCHLRSPLKSLYLQVCREVEAFSFLSI